MDTVITIIHGKKMASLQPSVTATE